MSSLRSYFAALAAIVLDLALTLICSALHINFAAAGFLHLLLVVFVAQRLGFLSATVVSVVANLSLNFFLVPPAHSFRVADPQNFVALLVFELCALVVSRLSGLAHTQHALAETRRAELEKLCSFSRRLLLLDRTQKPGIQILRIVQQEFAATSALFLDASEAAVQSIVPPETTAAELSRMEQSVRAAYFQNADPSAFDSNFFVRVMRLGSTPTGAISLAGPTITPFLSTAISLLCAIVLEREKSLDREALQSAERKSETLRVAVLDSLAHEYKTPLTAIRTAAEGLLEIGGLEPVQSDLVQLIDLQTCRLDSLTTELLQTSQIDTKEPGVQLETIHLHEFLTQLTSNMTTRLIGHAVHLPPRERCPIVLADRRLLAAALTQYLDNAAKYSSRSSPITLSVQTNSACATIGVHNLGSYVPPAERLRIFDRFHRVTSQSHSVSGTGIGLSIVAKVAAALNGKAWVASESETGTTFYLSLPTTAPTPKP